MRITHLEGKKIIRGGETGKEVKKELEHLKIISIGRTFHAAEDNY